MIFNCSTWHFKTCMYTYIHDFFLFWQVKIINNGGNKMNMKRAKRFPTLVLFVAFTVLPYATAIVVPLSII